MHPLNPPDVGPDDVWCLGPGGFDEIRYEWANEASPGEMETEISVVKRKTPVALQLMNK